MVRAIGSRAYRVRSIGGRLTTRVQQARLAASGCNEWLDRRAEMMEKNMKCPDCHEYREKWLEAESRVKEMELEVSALRRDINQGLPLEGQWVLWKKEPCPHCGDWLFCDGAILRCDCGKEYELTMAPRAV